MLRRAWGSAFVHRDLRAAIVPWIVARVLVVGALALARVVFDDIGSGPRPVQLRQGLFAWDAAFYRDLAEHGYSALGRPALRFFPLVPLLARGLGTVLLDHTAVALIVLVNGSALVLGALLHRLVVRETGDDGLAARATWFIAVFPPAAVLVMGYAEATAMALAVGTFLAMRTRRWWLAAVTAFLVGLARPVGVLLALPLAIEATRDWRTTSSSERIQRIVAVLAPVSGVAAYLVWAGARFGDAFEPIGAVTVVVALSAHNLDSLERYAMSAFPLIIGLGIVTSPHDAERGALGIAAGGLVGYSLAAFLGLAVP